MGFMRQTSLICKFTFVMPSPQADESANITFVKIRTLKLGKIPPLNFVVDLSKTACVCYHLRIVFAY